MSHRTTRLAWAMAAWGIALVAAGLTANALLPAQLARGLADSATVGAVSIGVVALGVLGALVASRQPQNAIGWMFTVAAIGFGYRILGEWYALRTYIEAPGSLPAGPWALWTLEVTSAPILWIAILGVLFLFPTGRPRSRPWKIVFVASVGAFIVLALAAAVGPTLQPVDAIGERPNPLYTPRADAIVSPLGNWSWLLGTVGMMLGAPALLVRFARARGIERQQLKWIALSALVAAIGGAMVLLNLFLPIPVIEETPLAGAFVVAGLGSIPLTAAVAILRYRLYDIDRIISRTASYAVVTGLLLGAYVGLVVLLQRATAPFTQGSDLAVAASVLVVAALFRPVRRRVQNGVDRRFNRARYDAARTVEAFGARLRDEVDIDALGAELAEVVRRTMQPAHVSIWTPDGGGDR